MPFKTFGAFSLRQCSSCGSLFFVPPPGESEAGADRPWESAKWYVERGANLLFYAEIVSLVQTLLEARSGKEPGRSYRVLEAGGSYGFLIDIGRVINGWEIAAADPADCARRGSLDLGIPLHSERVEEVSFGTTFDAVIGVQLVEHLHDPFAFAGALAGLLRDSGILLLTTPDASFEDLGPDYHPGEHVILFSQGGLEEVLRSAGLRHFGRYTLSLPQMLVMAAANEHLGETVKEDGPAAGDPAVMVESYLDQRLKAADLPGQLRAGLQFRLFEQLVNSARYGGAEELVESLETLMGRRDGQDSRSFISGLVDKMSGAGDHSRYEASGPGFTAPYLLYRGILELNHGARREEATFRLALAERLFGHEIGSLGLTQYAPFLAAARSALSVAGGRGA